MTEDVAHEELNWLLRVVAQRAQIEAEPGDQLFEQGMDSLTAWAVGTEIRKRFDIPWRVLLDWLSSLTAAEIAVRLASASTHSRRGAARADE